jgi:CheY-like chemotaxis protein
VALAEEILAELNYEPVGFDSSIAALQAFRAQSQRFDLVLTDETRPDLTGTEFARAIRKLHPEIPIILMGGYSGPQLSERAQAAGVADVLRKPLVRRDIAKPVARVLRANALPGHDTEPDTQRSRDAAVPVPIIAVRSGSGSD